MRPQSSLATPSAKAPSTYLQRWLACLLPLLLCLLAAPGYANSAAQPVSSLADGRIGRIWFGTAARTLFYYDVLHKTVTPSESIFGDLLMPGGASGQVPAMVIAHGSLGVNSTLDYAWAQLLNQMGIAVFIVDSFTGRGVKDVFTDQATIQYGSYVSDAFFALKLLATHPGIDKSRIGILGFSRGANVALYSAVEGMRRNVIGDKLQFAIHLGLYPYCNFSTANWTGAPVRLFLGGADDYTPALTCTRFAQQMQGRGFSFIQATSYAGAEHGFDSSYTNRIELPAAEVQARCEYLYDLDVDTYLRFDTGQTYPASGFVSYVAGCTSRGAHVGGQVEARRAVRAAIRQQLVQTFKLSAALANEQTPDDLNRTLNWAEGYYRFVLVDRTESLVLNGYRYRCYGGLACVSEKDGQLYLYANANTLSPLGALSAYLPFAIADGF